MKINLLIIAFVLLSVIVYIIPHQVAGDGFTQETLPPANVGNRTISLFVKINPPVITSESNQDRYLMFRWFDTNTNQTIQHTSFLVEVIKNNQILVQGIFHTHTGMLTLKVTPSNDPKSWTINGLKQQFLDGYAYSPLDNGTIDLVAPMLGEGGLYHIYVLLITIDNDQNFFLPQDSPKFDSFLSVGDVSNHTVTYKDNSYNSQLISYYDKTSDFNFVSSTLQFSWSMPFDWNATRLQNLPILMHQELRIPKSFNEFLDSQSFTATINNDSINKEKVIVDPYSFPDKTVIHIILNKNDIENFMKHTSLQTNKISFTISPNGTTITNNASVPEFGSAGMIILIGVIFMMIYGMFFKSKTARNSKLR